MRAGEQYKDDPEYREHRLDLCKNWREANPEKVAKTQANKWINNRDHLQAYHRQWRDDNAEKVAQDKIEWERQDKAKNPAKYSAKASATRAARLKRIPPWADMEAINFFYECRPEGWHVDHVVPLQGKIISGLHVAENLQWLPARENQSKANRFQANL